MPTTYEFKNIQHGEFTVIRASVPVSTIVNDIYDGEHGYIQLWDSRYAPEHWKDKEMRPPKATQDDLKTEFEDLKGSIATLVLSGHSDPLPLIESYIDQTLERLINV